MGPKRIICLTEESTEWLYLLGESERIVGISGYTVRPKQARLEKPRVSSFLDGKEDKILALRPDLVIGFSDMQAALADANDTPLQLYSSVGYRLYQIVFNAMVVWICLMLCWPHNL